MTITRRLFLGGMLAGAAAPATFLAERGMLDARLLVCDGPIPASLAIGTISVDLARHASLSAVAVMWWPQDGQPAQFAVHHWPEAA